MDTIAVIGLGYVGMPLALAFGQCYPVVGYDTDVAKVAKLLAADDGTGQCSTDDLKAFLQKNTLSHEPGMLEGCSIYIITVPTPVTAQKVPDLSQLLAATALVAGYLREGNVVIFESTVYPGCTEEQCIPLLEAGSGLKLNDDFGVGYSPERISVGQAAHSLRNTLKITSGSNAATAQRVDALYRSIIQAGTYPAPSIRVAEAAKAIENAQRDVNISFVNELALIFDKMGLDTKEVLAAAATKWNFMPFEPGLVGGHCIGVDPYYLLYKAQELGYHPQVLLSGRTVNDDMGRFVAAKTLKLMGAKQLPIKGSRALVLGITFKEDVVDSRNSKVVDIVSELQAYGLSVEVYDPLANVAEVKHEYNIDLIPAPQGSYDCIILAVPHSCLLHWPIAQYSKMGKTVVFDVKGRWPRELVDARL